MQISRLGPDQVPQLLGASALFDDPPSGEAARNYLEDDRNVFLLATEGVEPVGFLRGTALGQIRSIRRQMFIYEVSVAPAHRLRGVGKALIHALLEYCQARSFEEAFVFTDPGNTAAVELYRTTGAETETPADRMFVYRLDSGSPAPPVR